MSDHEFYPDGYGHGECRHCGLVEALHGDVFDNIRREERLAERARIVAWLRSPEREVQEYATGARRNRYDDADAIERGEHEEDA